LLSESRFPRIVSSFSTSINVGQLANWQPTNFNRPSMSNALISARRPRTEREVQKHNTMWTLRKICCQRLAAPILRPRCHRRRLTPPLRGPGQASGERWVRQAALCSATNPPAQHTQFLALSHVVPATSVLSVPQLVGSKKCLWYMIYQKSHIYMYKYSQYDKLTNKYYKYLKYHKLS
jgi:hypothetical protein